MKRILAFILSMIIFFTILTPCFSAQGSDESEILENSVYFTCTYNSEQDQILIDGTVNHDVMISHGDFTIQVFSILPGQSTDDVLNSYDTDALAESSMTVRFTFYIDVTNILERYSRYAVVLTSPEGVYYVAADPQLPSFSSEYQHNTNDRTGFKGLLSNSSFNIGNSGAGTVIVDFYLDQAMGDVTDSYLYPSGDSYFYIKKSYVNEIDKKLIAASLSNSNVYIRLLNDASSDKLSSVGGEDMQYNNIPDLYSSEVLDFVSAVTEFLAERYDGSNGKVYGFIPGSKVDDIYLGVSDKMTLEQYADLYTLYLAVVGNASRSVNNTFDIVIPLSDNTDNKSDTEKSMSAVLLENIISRLDKNVSGRFDCSVMIESDNIPENIYNKLLQAKSITNNISDVTSITSDNIGDYISYIHSLEGAYENAPIHVIYKWTPNSKLTGSALCCTYIYSYLRLLSYDDISSFIVDFSQDAENNYFDIEKVFCDIDTDEKNDIINIYSSYLGEESWDDIIENRADLPTLRTVLKKNFSKEKPEGIMGEFCYTNFSSSSIFEAMTQGQNCISLTSDYNSTGERILRVTSGAMSAGEYMETVGYFECPESYIYTNTLSFKVELDDNSDNKNAVYEIMLTLGSGNKRINVSGTLCPTESEVMYFDIGEFSDISNADYVKVSARCLTGDTQGFSLLLHDITGYSNEYTSEELKTLIDELRLKMQGIEDEDDNSFNKTIVITTITVVVSLIAVGIGLFMVFKRDEENGKG